MINSLPVTLCLERKTSKMDSSKIFNISDVTSHLPNQNDTLQEPLLPEEITIKEEPLDELLDSEIRPMEFLDLGSSQIKLESFEAVPVERRIVQDPLDPDDFEIKIENLEDENFVGRRIVQDPLAPDDFEIKIENIEDENSVERRIVQDPLLYPDDIEIKVENLEDENFGNLTSDQYAPDENGTDVSVNFIKDESSCDRLSLYSNCIAGSNITGDDHKELDQPLTVKNTINICLSDSGKPYGFTNESSIAWGCDSQENEGLLLNPCAGKVKESLISLNHLDHSHNQNNKINASVKAKQLSVVTDRSKAVRRCKVSLDFQINHKPSNISRRSRNSLLSALDSETEPNSFKEILEKLLVPDHTMARGKVGKDILKTSETSSMKSSHNLFERRRFKSKKIISEIRKDETAQCGNKTYPENEIKFVELSGKMIPIKRCYVLLERLQASDCNLGNDKEYPRDKMTFISDISNKKSKLISLQLYKDICEVSDPDSQDNNERRKIKCTHFDVVKMKESVLETSNNNMSTGSQCSLPSNSLSISSSGSVKKNRGFHKAVKDNKSKCKNIFSRKRLKKNLTDEGSDDWQSLKVTEFVPVSVAKASPQIYSSRLSDEMDTSVIKGSDQQQEQPDIDSDSELFLGWFNPYQEEKGCDNLGFSLDHNNSIDNSLSNFCQAVITVNMDDNGKILVTRNEVLFKRLQIKINDWFVSMSASTQNMHVLKDCFPGILKKYNITCSPIYPNKRAVYSCLFCDYMSFTKQFFYKHLWNHLVWYKCQFCHFINQGLFNIKQHLLGKHYSSVSWIKEEEKKPYACDTCGYRFNNKHKLVRHLKSHDDEKVKFICRICGYLGKRLINSESGALTLGKQDLIDHMMKMHQEKLYKCNICNYSSNENYVLDHHIKYVHQKIRLFSCEKCNFTSSNRTALTKHVTLVHDKIKAYTCHICNLKMGLKSTLDNHLLHVHYKQNMLYCQYCSYSTSRKQDFEVHRYNKHTVKEKKYVCYYCSFGSTNKRGVKLHIKRKHDLKKPYFCIYCTFKTKLKEDIEKHINRHMEKNPFKCSLCSYTTKVKSHLKQHMQIHVLKENPQNRFACFHCGQSYSRKGQMKRHIELKHIEKDLSLVLPHQPENLQSQTLNNSSKEAFHVQLNSSFQNDITQLVEISV